jgi:Ca2+-transporting ATPase
VPGDVVYLQVGDRVPADIRLVQLRTATVRCEQASLTGESVAASKTTDPVSDPDCELQVGNGHMKG